MIRFGGPRGLRDKWTDVFRSDVVIHVAMLGSITAATFQGWLKDRFGGPLPYVAADLLLIAAALYWFAGLAIRKAAIGGPGRYAALVLVLIAVPLLYLMVPGTPLAIEAAGLRGWIAFPVCGLMALTVTRNAGQVRAYVALILVLGLITALYGIQQYRTGPEAALEVTSLASLRHGSTTFYAIGGGRSVFRAFSTFTFPAPFAGFMVFAVLLAAGQVLSSRRPRWVRWTCLLLVPLYFVGMTVSGTRAGLVTLVLGLALAAWYRGLKVRQMLLLPVIFVALHVATLLTSGSILTRYATLYLQEGELWTYVYAPITIAARALAQNPFGLGLGRSGVGVPFSMVSAMPEGYFIPSDGDVGRAAVEMGLIGLLLLVVLVVGLLPYAHRAARQLLKTRDEDLALGIGPLVLGTGVLVLIGSPLSTAPHGAIWWFLFGALVKVAMLERRRAAPAADVAQEVHAA